MDRPATDAEVMALWLQVCFEDFGTFSDELAPGTVEMLRRVVGAVNNTLGTTHILRQLDVSDGPGHVGRWAVDTMKHQSRRETVQKMLCDSHE